MAKTKAALLEEAQAKGLEVNTKNTIAEIREALEGADPIAESGEQVAEAEAADVAQKKVETSAKSTTKAGKRSAKAQREAEAQRVKEERKAAVVAGEAEAPKPSKQPVKPTRSRLERRGKKFRKAAEQIEKGKTYSLEEAAKLAVSTSPVKFDATVELHVNLNVDPRQADQNIRGNVILPEGTGKQVRVAVFSDDKAEGADLSGVETITKQLEKGVINFDVLVATPGNMPKLGKYARLLGPRGLMPNPKSGTVTNDIVKGVSEAKAGRVEYRVDSTGIVHLGVGKVSFGDTRLVKNIQTVIASIRSNKPSSLKGTYMSNIYLTTTMGPSISIEASQ